MALTTDMLRAAFADLPPSEGDDVIARGKPVAARLCAALESALSDSAAEDIHYWALNVEFSVRNGDHWTIECLSPDAFRMYPGFERGGVITWANVWVRGTDMDLDELVKDINVVAYRATKEELQNA
jgi:hypothetical protein